MMVLELLGGLVYLLLAGDLLVRGSVALARRAEIPPVVVGLTLVAFGTSAPELFVSVAAVTTAHPGIAVGNVVGSNIANVLLVLGLPALIAPTACSRESVGAEVVWMLGASLLFVALCLMGPIGRIHGLLLVTLLVLMLLRVLQRTRGDVRAEAEAEEELQRVLGLPTRRRMIALFLVLGGAGLPLGAWLLVDGAVAVARTLGVSEAAIGVTVVALGTSLPELATTLVAAWKRHGDVAIGNVLGSNLFNILAIMGTAAVVAPQPIPIPDGFVGFDLLVMLGAACWLAWLAWKRGIIGRVAGGALMACYLGYLTAVFLWAPGRQAIEQIAGG
jgi:cation:H+ antiporter